MAKTDKRIDALKAVQSLGGFTLPNDDDALRMIRLACTKLLKLDGMERQRVLRACAELEGDQ